MTSPTIVSNTHPYLRNHFGGMNIRAYLPDTAISTMLAVMRNCSRLIVCALAVASVTLATGCGNSDDQTKSAGKSNAERADAYAIKKSGGETLGCSNAKPGKETRRTPGCIYSAAFTGCVAALGGTGREVATDEADLPELQDVYDKAYRDCSTDPPG